MIDGEFSSRANLLTGASSLDVVADFASASWADNSDVKNALINLTSARSQVQVANLGVQLSKEEVDQAGDRFRAGVTNNIEVIQAQDSLARANDNQIAALYRFNQARADLARSVGQMERVYSK